MKVGREAEPPGESEGGGRGGAFSTGSLPAVAGSRQAEPAGSGGWGRLNRGGWQALIWAAALVAAPWDLGTRNRIQERTRGRRPRFPEGTMAILPLKAEVRERGKASGAGRGPAEAQGPHWGPHWGPP